MHLILNLISRHKVILYQVPALPLGLGNVIINETNRSIHVLMVQSIYKP
jgi:hypothetical protein